MIPTTRAAGRWIRQVFEENDLDPDAAWREVGDVVDYDWDLSAMQVLELLESCEATWRTIKWPSAFDFTDYLLGGVAPGEIILLEFELPVDPHDS